MANLKDHQYAAEPRAGGGFNGNGRATFICVSEWGTDNLGLNDQHRLFKAARDCFVSNFSLTADELDEGTAIALDVGTDTDDNEFIAASTIARTGGTELTNVVNEATEAGFPLAAGEYVIISVQAAATTAQAGKTTVTFDCQFIDN